MGSSLRDLSPRQLERLKSELAEVIIANFCYPSFLDYRLNMLRTRPVDRRKRQEVWAYVNSLNLSALGTMDATSLDFRRFVERVFLRYIEMNRRLLGAFSQRQVAAARARVPQLAVNVARGLADYLALGEASSFGRARPIESWATLAGGRTEPGWEQIEKSTQLLQTTLVYLRTYREAGTAPSSGSGPQHATADISTFPTKVLTPPSSGLPSALPEEGGSVASGNGLPAALNNGLQRRAEQGEQLSSPPPRDGTGARRQFLGPDPSRTTSRPIGRPFSLPALPPVGDLALQISQPPALSQSRPAPAIAQPPAVPLQDSSASASPAQPLPPDRRQPAQPPDRPASAGPKAPVPSAPSQPAPSSLAPSDAWQALLWPGAAELRGEPSGAEPGGGSSKEPAIELPDLPESFDVPAVLELPPDLAELYGDYLRDAHAGVLDLAPAESAGAVGHESEDGPAAAPALDTETEEEIDQLFNALTSKIAEHEEGQAHDQSARREQPQQAGSSEARRSASPPLSVTQHPETGSALQATQDLTISSGRLPGRSSPDSQHDNPGQPTGSQHSNRPSASSISSGGLPSRLAGSRPLDSAEPQVSERPASAPLSASGPGSQPVVRPAERMPGSGELKSSAGTARVEGDVMIFAQLQHQVTTWVKMAAVSHQIEITGRGAMELVAELRRTAALDEAELQVIESLVALCQRVTTTKQATVDDYKQAMMLYLLHHRSRLAL